MRGENTIFVFCGVVHRSQSKKSKVVQEQQYSAIGAVTKFSKKKNDQMIQ